MAGWRDGAMRAATAVLRRLPAERAHRLTIRALAAGLAPRVAWSPPSSLAVRALGLEVASPLGVAAGFDKNAEVVDALLGLGAGFVEIGAVTPRPQAGNPTPRLFRLREDRAIVNRLGFNNQGMEAAATRLRARAGRPGVVGVNIGANKHSVDRMADYEAVLRRLWGLAAFYTVNVSSPNTERLRDLQGRAALAELLGRMRAQRDALAGESGVGGALLVKIAPDLSDAEIDAVAEVALEAGVDGVIATNTTTARPESLRSRHARQAGGLSGAPLRDRATAVLARLAARTEGRLTLIGVGGIATAEDAYARIRAGATLLQLYSALVYDGPALLTAIPDGMARLLARDGFARLADAVGVDRPKL